MPWNEPGGGQRDPWGRGSGSGGGDKGPDLDKLLKRLRAWLGRFGGGSGSWITALVALALAWTILNSYTVIGARQVGVVLRFGRYARRLPPGFHFKLPVPSETVSKGETTRVRSISDIVSMLTNDENIITVDFIVQYQVSNARNYLFSMANPDGTLKQAAEAAVRSVVGASNMDTLLSGQGAALVAKTRDALQKTLNTYNCGLVITEGSFQNVAPPPQVKEAFDDVNKAREDKQRIENEAHAYASQIIPEARGKVARISAQAAGYKAERVARAHGDAKRFDLLSKQYRRAPQVTRERLWLETVEGVLAHNPKVYDGGKGRNVFYLPLGSAAAKVAGPPLSGAKTLLDAEHSGKSGHTPTDGASP